jgi:hypothetical protein
MAKRGTPKSPNDKPLSSPEAETKASPEPARNFLNYASPMGTEVKLNNPFKIDISNFTPWTQPARPARDFDEREFDVQLDDYKWRLKARKIYGFLLIALLFIQNAYVGWLVCNAFVCNDLKNLSTVLGFIVNGTLIETAFIIRIIVKWLFSDIPYRNTK